MVDVEITSDGRSPACRRGWSRWPGSERLRAQRWDGGAGQGRDLETIALYTHQGKPTRRARVFSIQRSCAERRAADVACWNSFGSAGTPGK